MGTTDHFTSVLGRLERTTADETLLPVRLARACAETLAVDGVGINLFTNTGLRVPVGASDSTAAVVEQLQFTVGQGPGYQARDTSSVVQADEPTIADSWPVLHSQLVAKTPIRSISAYPLSAPMAALGTVDLFSHSTSEPPSVPAEVEAIVDLITTILLDSLLQCGAAEFGQGPPPWLSIPLGYRQDIVLAMGMVNAALEMDNAESLALLRGHAYAADISLQDTAHRVLTRQLAMSDLDVDSNC